MYNRKKDSYVAHPFNFYVFPCEFRGLDKRFLCQTRCMQFLANSSFDFNKLFKAGIPWLNHEEEELLRASGGKHAAFVAATRAALVDFLCDASQHEMVLPHADGFHRMLIYREMTDVFSDGVLRHEKADIDGELRVRVLRTEHTALLGSTRAEIEESVAQRARSVDEAQMQRAIGFRHVVDLLVSMRKPLVGHNMLLDMMMFEAQFNRDLPPQLEQFKAALHERFPCLIDTKHVLAAAPQPLARLFTAGTRLDMVFRTVNSAPFDKPKVDLGRGADRYRSQRLLHEAGFDAYMTGVAVLRLAHFHHKAASPSRSASPVSLHASPAHTGLTPRLRQLGGGAALRPAEAMLDALAARGYINKLHVFGCARVLYIDTDSTPHRHDSPLGEGRLSAVQLLLQEPTCQLGSPKRGRLLVQDLDSSVEHESAHRRSRLRPTASSRGSALQALPRPAGPNDVVTPPHTATSLSVSHARPRAREALARGAFLNASASTTPQEKRPRMSL